MFNVEMNKLNKKKSLPNGGSFVQVKSEEMKRSYYTVPLKIITPLGR